MSIKTEEKDIVINQGSIKTRVLKVDKPFMAALLSFLHHQQSEQTIKGREREKKQHIKNI